MKYNYFNLKNKYSDTLKCPVWWSDHTVLDPKCLQVMWSTGVELSWTSEWQCNGAPYCCFCKKASVFLLQVHGEINTISPPTVKGILTAKCFSGMYNIAPINQQSLNGVLSALLLLLLAHRKWLCVILRFACVWWCWSSVSTDTQRAFLGSN